MKKQVGLGVTILMILSVLSGCSGSGTTKSSDNNTSSNSAGATSSSSDNNDTTAEVDWPTGQVNLYVPATAGGTIDVPTRILGNYLQKETGVPFVVVNQTGGNGAVCYDTVRTAKPDGTNLMMTLVTIHVASHSGLYGESIPDNFEAIGVFNTLSSWCIAVPADSPYNTLDELVSAAKANPGKITFGIQNAATSHLIPVKFAQAAGCEFNFVESGTNADKITALTGGHIAAATLSTPSTKQYVEAGQLKVLGVISPDGERDPYYTEYPSAVELGYDGAVWQTDFFLYGPKGMDPKLVEKINDVFRNANEAPEVVEVWDNMGQPMTLMTVEEAQAYQNEKDDEIAALCEAAGLK